MNGQQVPQGAFPQGVGMGQRPAGMPGGRGGFLFFGPYGSVVMIALLVITYAVLAISFWQMFKKLGLTPTIALLMLVPVVNIGVAIWAAFAEWPLLKVVARLRMIVATSATESDAGATSDTGAPTIPQSPAAEVPQV